jgi:hypothetical protein
MKLRPNSASELTRIIDREVLPLLRKQAGFCDEVTFIAPERSEAVTNSFWDTKADAEAYGDATYPLVLKALGNVVEGAPVVETFELANSTFHTGDLTHF